MAEIFYLPQMGQTMTEATILKWLKQEGDRVEGWEAVVEMMTDKINMEVEPQISGTLRKILAPEGTIVPVGAPIGVLGAPDEDLTAVLAHLQGPPGAAAEAADPHSTTASSAAPSAPAGPVPPLEKGPPDRFPS